MTPSAPIPFYHVDAFTAEPFKGNPAAVCLLPEWLPEETLQAIARENNLPVTAFLVREDSFFHIRWLTPHYELDLCGHGSLAAAYVVFNHLEKNWESVRFQSRWQVLEAMTQNDWITLKFPAKKMEAAELPLLIQGLGLGPHSIYKIAPDRCCAVYESEAQIKQLKPNFEILKQLNERGITVTAKGDAVDFVSRTFYPKIEHEDAVTGVTHCFLAPYWTAIFKKNKLQARQLSERGGELWCEYDQQEESVLLSSQAVLYQQGILV